MEKQKKPIPKQIEIWFNILYLVSAVVLGGYLLFTSSGNNVRFLWGIMSLTLAFGDSFHLLPRIMAAITGDTERFRKSMGIGKMLTSITMTFFYCFLWHCGLIIFSQSFPILTVLIWVLAGIRIGLCLMVQNKWTYTNPSYNWGIYRNIPFVIMGAMVLVLFAIFGNMQFKLVWLAILLSFAFYIPVVLWADKYPKIGMLMLPKTLSYVWIICMAL